MTEWSSLVIRCRPAARALIALLGGAQPVIPPNLYIFMNIIVWGPPVVLDVRTTILRATPVIIDIVNFVAQCVPLLYPEPLRLQ